MTRPLLLNLPSVALFALTTLVSASAMHADQLYDNGLGGAAGINDAFASDQDVSIWGADDFTIGVGGTIESVQWTGVYAFLNTPPATDSFTINIYADNSGLPGGLLSNNAVGNAVNRLDSGIDEPNFGFDVFEYSADIAPFNYTAGTTYWISIVANTAGEDDDWLWGIQNGTGNLAQSVDSGSSWLTAGHQADFRLSGSAVPEPSSLSLPGIALFLFGRRPRRASLTARSTSTG